MRHNIFTRSLVPNTFSCLILSIVLTTFASIGNTQELIVLPKFNEEEMKAKFDSYISKLDSISLSRKYPEIVKRILSSQTEQQEIAARMLGESQDPNAIPWLLLLVDSKDEYVSLHSALAIKEIVVSLALKRRDPRFGGFVVLKPATSKDINLKPLAWLALSFMRNNDPNLIANGMMMSRYLNVVEFESTIWGHKDNINPAVTKTMEWVLRDLNHQKRYDAGELKPNKR